MATNGRTRLIVEVPNDVKKNFKLYCAVNDIPMTLLLEQLVTNFLKDKNWNYVEAKKG